MDLNKAMIIGRLTRDPELRTTPNGSSVCTLSLATNYVYTNQQTGQKVEQVEFHNVILWRKLAEIANQYVKKGQRIYIEGRIQSRSWDGKDGVKRNRTEIVADNMIMLDGGSKGGQPTAGGNSFSATPASKAPASNGEQPFINEELPTITQDAGEDINVDDIPF
jgi:single-strand DNA-binding protein